MTPNEWIVFGDVGISSKTIWAALMRDIEGPQKCGHFLYRGDFDIPYDPSDFLCCHKLLQSVPGWRDRLYEVAAVFPKWRPFVEAWPELERLYEKEKNQRTAPRLYRRMQEVGKLAYKAERIFFEEGEPLREEKSEG